MWRKSFLVVPDVVSQHSLHDVNEQRYFMQGLFCYERKSLDQGLVKLVYDFTYSCIY